jgi:hypothetical protein
VGILATIKKESAGDWLNLPDYLKEARHRETGALQALAGALTAPPEEQKELAQGEGAAVLLELARDLRVPKGGRLAAARCLLEAGISGADLGLLFSGAGDLITDPRMGGAARKLAEGLPAALQAGGEASKVSLAAGTFARSVQAAASTVGQARVKELLTQAPAGHAGAAAGLFALGQGELPADQLAAWKKLLESTCAANRKAPAAAKRMNLAPPWPPNLPEAFAPLVQEAEKKNEGVVAADAAVNPALVKPAARPVAAPKAPPGPASGPEEAPWVVKSSSEMVGTRTLSPAIRRSPFRRPTGTVMEVPTRVQAKPMEPVTGRPSPSAIPPPPASESRPHVPEKDDGIITPKVAPLPGLTPLMGREANERRFDPRGRPIPRPDRWKDMGFDWEEPVLPSSEMPQPMKAGVASGPFAQRVQSLVDNRPEAVDRLCAAAEARALVVGEEKLLQDLSQELGRKRWKDARLPTEQVQRLKAMEADETQPGPWRAVARHVLDRISPA